MRFWRRFRAAEWGAVLVASAIAASVLTGSPASAGRAGLIAERNHYVQNLNSGKCLSTGDSADGTAAFQYACLRRLDQVWLFTGVGGNSYRLTNQIWQFY
jgi:hypothetical protein